MRSPETQKDFCPADAAPHTHQHPLLIESFRDDSLHFSAWGGSQHRAVTHSAADTDACAKLPDFEGTPLAPFTETKLPGNIAHDHIRHAHSARPHTMTSLPAHPALLKHQAARSSQKSAKRAMFQCNAQCNTT